MGSPLTLGSTVQCGHGGTVAVQSSAKLTVGGQAVLVAASVEKKSVASCSTPPSSTTKPCTKVESVLPPSLAAKLTAGGAKVVLATLVGLTDGAPPGNLLAAAQQTKLTAV